MAMSEFFFTIFHFSPKPFVKLFLLCLKGKIKDFSW